MRLPQRLAILCMTLLCFISLTLGAATNALAGNSNFIAGDNNSLNKAIIDDTYIDPPSTATDKIVRIGDTVTYRLTLNLSEGTTGSLTVLDVFSNGLAYSSLVSITPASGSGPFTYTVISQPASGATGDVIWDLGDVVNTPSNDGTPVDALIIEYRATVLPNFGISSPIADLIHTATLGYLDAGGIPVIDPVRLVSSETVTVVQPSMSRLVKLGNGIANTAATPLDVFVATDTVQFHLESCNSNGLAPAYGVEIRDDLASQFDETSLSAALVAIGGTVLGAGDYTYTPPSIRGGRQIFVINIPVNSGQCVTIDYSSGFHNDFGPNQLWSNDATLVGYSSLPTAGGQDYRQRTPAQFYMTNPVPLPVDLQKVVDKPVANPGERVQYTLTLQNPMAILLPNLTLVDNLEALNTIPMFQPGSISNIVVPAGAIATVSGSTLTVTNLDLAPNGSQTILFDAVLATNLASGSIVLNQAQLTGPWPAPILSDDPTRPGIEDPTLTTIPANGLVYDTTTRRPLAGVTLTMQRASTAAPLPASCFIDPLQQNQVTQADGAYKFDLVFDPTNCPSGADYLIVVTATPTGYLAEPSLIELPVTSAATAAYPVPTCPADAIPSSTLCEADASSTVPAGAPTYYLHLTFDATANQIHNNHIPVDQQLAEEISISKTSPLINVTRGQIVPYKISVKNTLRSVPPPLGVVDIIPPGFKYVSGSSRFDGSALEPSINGRQLRWDNLAIGYNQTHTIELLLRVGAGVSESQYVNQAVVIDSSTDAPLAPVATATVRVVPDPTLDCTDVIGKVFDDRNLDGLQGEEEQGLAGVRVVTARGLIATSDAQGRFHITCAAVPDEDRGSNFILKLDDRTLPTGYRLTTENPRVQRATRGKVMRFNFGATIHRVVTLDIADGVYEPGSTTLRLQWQPKIDRLLAELQKAPSVLRLSYLADIETEELVNKRLKALKKMIADHWEEQNDGYRLDIETEVFWRRGGPP